MTQSNNHPFQKASLFCVLLALMFFVTGASQAEEAKLEAGMVNPGYHETPNWFKQSFLDISEDIQEAAANNKRLILYFYQDGCPYCAKLLRDNFGQRNIATKTQRYFDLIAINMWGDRELTWIDGNIATEKTIAARMKVMFTPTMLFLNERGGVSLRMNGYYAPDKFDAALEYVGRRMEGRMSFQDYYKQQKPVSASGKLHQAKFILQQNDLVRVMEKNDKPLLVLFEQKQCKACDELHSDIFTRKETLEQLQRFNVVRFDMWSEQELVTPQDRITSAKHWAKQLRIQYAPTMVMFDSSGKEIIRTEAYLKTFHIQSVMDYAASGAYKTQLVFSDLFRSGRMSWKRKGYILI